MRGLRFRWVPILFALALLGLMGAAPPPDGDPQGPAPATPDTPGRPGVMAEPLTQTEGVQVPVILDGLRYEPEEFNRIQATLNRWGIHLCFTFSRNGALHAFSTKEACDRFLQEEWGNPPIAYPPPVRPLRVWIEGNVVRVEPADEVPPSGSLGPQQLCPPPDPFWSRNWEHIHCQGWELGVNAGGALSDLRQVPGPCAGNWNDCISSAQAATGISQLVMWEHINFQGNYLAIPRGWTAPDLREFNWNDRASSLYAQP